MSPTTSGWRTSEFAITVVTLVCSVVAAAGVFSSDPDRWAQVCGVISTAVVTAVYSISRGITKSGVAKADGAVEAARIQSTSLPAVSTAPSRVPLPTPMPPRTGP